MVLIGYWPLNETSGDTAYDRSGQGNHGNLNGSITQGANGILGNNAYSFDGTDDWISTAWGGPVGSFSVTAWVKPETINGRHYVISQHNTDSEEWLLEVEDINDGTDSVRGFLAGSSNSQVSAKTSVSGRTGEWMLIGFVWHNSTQTFDVFLDGAKKASASNSNIDYSGQSPQDVSIARQGDASQRYFDGVISDIRVYNHALTAQEVQYLYQVSQGGRMFSGRKQT